MKYKELIDITISEIDKLNVFKSAREESVMNPFKNLHGKFLTDGCKIIPWPTPF